MCSFIAHEWNCFDKLWPLDVPFVTSSDVSFYNGITHTAMSLQDRRIYIKQIQSRVLYIRFQTI